MLRGIDLWSPRAELAVIHEDLPWADLLAGLSPDQIIDRDKAGLVGYLRGKGLGLAFIGDPTDGLDRAQESRALRDAGRSLAEPAIRRLYRDYLVAIDRRLSPQYLGLAAETNLIRLAAPASLYGAVREACAEVAADLASAGSRAIRLVSVQVETAWGVLGERGAYRGIDTDLADFPAMQALGLSSYPYFGWASPEAIPDDYFSRVVGASALPVLASEGGWPSAAAGTIEADPNVQARWIARQATLLDSVRARAWLHLVFADLDLAAFPPPIPPNLPLFASIGLVDRDFTPKPALAAWDALKARPYRA